MELTGPAGEYGKAGAKSIEMAFRDFNAPAASAAANSSWTPVTAEPGQCRRRSGDPARQHQEGAGDHRRHHLVGVDPDPDLGHRACRRAAGLARLVLADADGTGREGKTNGVFFRTITSDALQGTAAAKYAIDQGLKKIAIINVNNDFGVNMVKEFSAAYTKLGGVITSTTPYNEKQASYSAKPALR